MVYAGGPNGVAAFGVERCTSNVLCPDCLSNKDPYCAWVGTSCVLASSNNIKTDVHEASQCPPGMSRGILQPIVVEMRNLGLYCGNRVVSKLKGLKVRNEICPKLGQ